MRRPLPFACLLLAALLLGGCASWSGHGVVADQGEIPIVLLPVRITDPIEKLSEIAPVPATEAATEPVDETAAIQAELDTAAQRITTAMAARLDASPALRASIATPELLTGDEGEPLPPEAVARRAGAAAALEIRVTGYGRLKRRWIALLLAKGMVEATVDAVIAWHVFHNTWASLGLFLEELTVETLTWGGGAKLYNAHYSPVILEARLVAARDGKKVWGDMVVVPTDRKALKKLPEAEHRRRDVQLAVTSDRAVRRLSKTLSKAAARHLSRAPRPAR